MAEATLMAATVSDSGVSPAHSEAPSEFSTSTVSTPRVSKRKRSSKISVLENRMDGLETKIDRKFDEILSNLSSVKSAFHVSSDNTNCTSSRTNVIRKPDGNLVRTVENTPPLECLTQNQENVPPGERRPSQFQDNIPTGDCRPTIDLYPRFEEDNLSLHPGAQESRDFYDEYSDRHSEDRDTDSVSVSDVTHAISVPNNSVANSRFAKYIDEPSKQQNLSDLFGEETVVQPNGLVIQTAQLSMLEKPDKLSAYREESRQCFPIHEDSLPVLKVPSLDDLLEPMINKKHGAKAVKNWGKSRTLYTQPVKSVEGLAFQGQLASRMGIISTLYLQQALGTLLQNFEHNEKHFQAVKDMYAMSTKTLDQLGRAGAFHHLIRRKCASSESGLNNLTNITFKMMYLPLTGEGVFGSGLEKELKHRKDKKEQLKDLVPELNYRPPKRSFNHSDYPEPQYSNVKRQKLDQGNYAYGNTRGRGRQVTPAVSKPVGNDNYGKRTFPSGDRNTSRSGGAGNTGPGTFRIPKKQ